MAEFGTVTKYTWGFGRYIGEPEADDIQAAIEVALDNIHLRLTGYGAISHPIAVESAPPDLNVNLGPGSAITYTTGAMLRWTGAQVIDVTNATEGTHLGATLVAGAGNRRYVVIGVKASTLDQQPGTDYNGLPYFYEQTAECEFEVYMSAEVLLADDWQNSATFDALLAEMRAADVEPLVLVMRTNGVLTISDAAIFDCSRWLWEQGSHRAEHLDERQWGAYAHFPVIKTATGTVAVVGIGTSSLDFAGGEGIWIGWNSVRNDNVIQQRSVTMPVTSIDTSALAAGVYVARMYLDSERGEVVVYSDTTTLLYPRDAALALDAHGPAGAGFEGFPPTLVDCALAMFTVNGAFTITAIVPIANTAQSWVTHVIHASSVLYDNTIATYALAATNVQDALDELADEKLSVDGSIAMTGDLDMGLHAVTNVGNVDGRDVSVDGALLDDHDTEADARIYPLRMVYRGGPTYFHPQRLTTALDCDWTGFRLWTPGGHRQGGAGGGLSIANKQYDVIAKIDSSADPELQNVTDDGLPAATEHVVARYNSGVASVERYMDLAHWSAERLVLGFDMHLANAVGAAELEVTPGITFKEGRSIPHPAVTTLTMTPAGLPDPGAGVGRKDSAWGWAIGWRYIYVAPLAVYNSFSGATVVGHDLSGYIFVSNLAPDYTGGHPTWPWTQFLGAVYCTAAGAGVEEWRSMTKRGEHVTMTQVNIAIVNPSAGVSPLAVPLTNIVPPTSQTAILSLRMEDAGGAGITISAGGHPWATVTEGYPWQWTLGVSEVRYCENLRMPLYRGSVAVTVPTFYLFSTCGVGDVDVTPYIHGYHEDPLRPYFYEP